jgi:hypothetical protein
MNAFLGERSGKSWSTAPTRTAICNWRSGATSGSTHERGPYWYFQLNEGGKRKKLYLGKTDDPEGTLDAKRAKLAKQ